jgi:DAK2 domain fusion protein YloV
MGDPSIERFRRVVASAYGTLEARSQEVNDLNVFPVADGDTGTNMSMTMRALAEELEGLDDGRPLDEIGRAELVSSLARAALLGARGNSGVILSQIIRGAAEELASRPGEPVDPTLVASAFAQAADAAYEAVRDPVEGTMLTVFREIAHSVSRQLAHIDPGAQRLEPGVAPGAQDAVLAAVLEQAIADGQKALDRTPEQLDVLAEAGVVDAGGYGLILILTGVLAALRGEEPDLPEPGRYGVALVGRPHHSDSKYRYCTNFIVTGTGLTGRDFIPSLEEMGDSVLVVGDASTLKVHVHTDDPEQAMALFSGVGEVGQLDVADMRRQVAERNARLAPARTGLVAVASGPGLESLMAGMGALVVPGGETMNPSTSEILAGIRETGADSVIVLPNSSNVVLAAERACEMCDVEAVVIPTGCQQEGLLGMVGFESGADLASNRTRIEEALGELLVGGVAQAARDDVSGRFRQGDAVGLIGDEVVAWGGTGSTLAAMIERVGKDRELVTVIAGEGAPIPLDSVEEHSPDGIEIELHEGGQPAWWWLLAGQ